jgi:hypothetical protein
MIVALANVRRAIGDVRDGLKKRETHGFLRIIEGFAGFAEDVTSV